MYRIVMHTEDETWDETYNRYDLAVCAAWGLARLNDRAIDVYYEVWGSDPLVLSTYIPNSGWTPRNNHPVSVCCNSDCNQRDCLEPECIRYDVVTSPHVPHTGSRMCKSGKRPHCTCDSCY